MTLNCARIAAFPLLFRFIVALCALCGASGTAVTGAVWNIADHGAKPGADVTEIIRAGLATQTEHGLPVFIPGHTYYISDTITLPFRDGVALAGVTVGSSINPKSKLAGASSQLVWTGKGDRPMFIVTGSSLRIAGGLALIGRPANTSYTKCQLAIQITKTGPGLGTGKIRIDWLLLEDFEIGIKFGSIPAEGNCDEVTIEQITYRQCGIGYQVINGQSMGHRIGHVHVFDTPVTFDFLGGGTLSLDSATTIGGTLLRLQKNDPSKFSPGSNNASFRLDEVKVDAQAGQSFRLVEMLDPLHADIFSTGGRLSGPASGTLAMIQGPTSLTLRDWANIRAGSIVSQHHKQGDPNVLLDRCRLWCKPEAVAASQSNGATPIKFRDCFGGHAEPFEDGVGE